LAFDRTKRQTVVAAGISVGSENITAGTVTGAFIDLEDGKTVVVSNRHVLEGEVGKTAVLQPGPYDGGKKPSNVIGYVKKLVQWDVTEMPWWKRIICFLFGWLLEEWCMPEKKPNTLDAGVATWQPTDESRKLESGVYMDDGSILKVKNAMPGDGITGRNVWKIGRTTGLSIGYVRDDSVMAKVWYGDRWRIFYDVVLVDGYARPGDSGSPVFLLSDNQPSENDAFVGLLFAGSSDFYLFCKNKYLERDLKVRWSPE